VKPRPVLLAIFDGFGVNPSRAHNAWALARTPHLDNYFATNPHTVLQASGRAVGLPDGQFGNSEVGHLTLGSGRVLEQDLIRIANAIYDGSFEQLPEWRSLIDGSKRLHLIGLISDGGVHSHIEHLHGILSLLRNTEIEPVIHMITDGRDTAPRVALNYLDEIEEALASLGRGSIATVTGRYTAMDRARLWDRTEVAWQAMVMGQGLTAATPREAIETAYARGEGDEFIQPTVIAGFAGIDADDPVLFFNFRSDRVRQLTAACGLEKFDHFDRNGIYLKKVVCMTEYNATFPLPVLFPSIMPEQILSEVISEAGLAQLHCSETEKFAHVTYFFNGGHEPPYPLEDRIIVPSPAVATYDMQPEMSAPQIADELIKAIESGKYSFIVTNFANADMVGHTADRDAIISAVEAMDKESHRVFDVALENDWRIMLTADHGNCDEIVDPNTGGPHTQHTEYPVPFLIMGQGPVKLSIGRGLADIAPTVLELLGIPQPPVMTGRSLILKKGLR
jgi:2,3-bisphosphoglycerate-independent phosphoglycerate mutase